MNTIDDLYTAIKTKLSVTGLTVYTEIKPASETGNCIVLSTVPVKKNNANSINDMVIFVYLLKVKGFFNRSLASTLFSQIESALEDNIFVNNLSGVTEKIDPQTFNLSDTYTVSQLTYRIINF